jgi:hypothetical protein
MTVSAAVRGRRKGVRWGLRIGGALLLLLVLAQVFLPRLAEKLVKDRLSHYGTVKSVSVSAWPAIELLWRKADSASVSAGSLDVSASQLAQITKQIWEARGVTNATMTAERATVGASGLLTHGVTASDVRAEKRGSELSASATLTQQQLQEALPDGFHVQLLESGGGQVRVRASGGLFGVQASINALIKPVEGRLVAEPEGLPFGGFASITLLSAPHLKLESVAMTVVQSQPLTYRLSVRASLR